MADGKGTVKGRENFVGLIYKEGAVERGKELA
jgi:hypothetical protein